LGALQTVLNLGLVSHTAAAGTALPADAEAAFIALAVVNGVVGSVTYWLLILSLLLLGLAMSRASELGHDFGTLPRGLCRLGRVVAGAYWLAALAQVVGGLAGLESAFVVYQVVILVGSVVFAPLWAFWLGRTLHPTAAPARTLVDAPRRASSPDGVP
jgi:hypothetical protein